MILKLGMEHYVLKLYKVYINDDPELTLTHFKTMSDFSKLFCTYSRPSYQVSVYTTIRPLVVVYEQQSRVTLSRLIFVTLFLYDNITLISCHIK